MKTWHKLLGIIILALILRTIVFRTNNFLGSDTFHHIRITDYYKENGFSHKIYENDTCMERTIRQPFGFYFIPTILPFRAETSIKLTIILFTIINTILFYLYAKRINKDYAIVATLILAVSYINITRSNIWYYRGDHLIMPFILGALLLINKPLISGIILGAGSFVWQGYPVGIIAYNITLGAQLLYTYFKEKKVIKKGISLITGNLIVFIILIIKTQEVLLFEDIIIKYYSFLIAGLILGVLILKSTKKMNKKKKTILLTGIIMLLVISYFVIKPDIKPMELIRPESGFFTHINELTPFSWSIGQNLYVNNILLLFPIGIVLMLLKKPKKLLYYSGLGIPSIYLFFQAIRFRYIASYSIIILFTYLFYYFRKKKITRILTAIAIILLILTSAYNARTLNTILLQEHQKAVSYIKENDLSNHCLYTIWDRGSIYLYYGLRAKMDSVSGQYLGTISNYFRFLMDEKDDMKWVNNSVIIVEQEDWIKIPYILRSINKNMSYDIEIIRREENNYFKSDKGTIFYIRLEPSFNTFMIKNNKTMVPETTYLQLDKNTYKIVPENTTYPIIPGCLILYHPNAGLWVSKNLCNTTLGKLLLTQAGEQYELKYSTSWMKIYRVNQ